MTTVTVEIGSQDVTANTYNLNYKDDLEAVETMKMTLTRNHSGAAITQDQYVSLAINGSKHFNGYIETYTDEINYELKCVSNGKKLSRVRASDVYSGAKLTTIAGSLVQLYSPFDITNIVDNSATMTEFRAEDSVQDALDKINKTLAWQQYVTPLDEFYLEPKGTTSSGKTLIIGSNCEKLGKWVHSESKLINKLTVVGETPDITITYEDADSIGSYGIHEPSAHHDKTATTRTDARKIAKSIVDARKDPTTKGTLKTHTVDPDMRAGRTIGVVDSKANQTISGTYTIHSVEINYGSKKGLNSMVTVGDEIQKGYSWEKDLDRRIKDLESAPLIGSPVFKNVNTSDTINATTSNRVRTRDIGSTAIYDHPTHTLDGTGTRYDWCGSTWHEFYSNFR